MSDVAVDQRPRERLLRLGSHTLTDAELVAVLVGTGRPGENALALAHRLLADYGGVGGLAATRPQQLAKVEVLPVADGCSDSAVLPVRDVLSLVLRHDGHAFAVAHNHPTGDPTPSAADRKATERLTAAADAAGLRFLGHLILGDTEWRSA